MDGAAQRALGLGWNDESPGAVVHVIAPEPSGSLMGCFSPGPPDPLHGSLQAALGGRCPQHCMRTQHIVTVHPCPDCRTIC